MVSALCNPETAAIDRITDGEFSTIRQLIHDRFGINLSDQKRTLVVGRLQAVLRQRGFADFGAYLDWLRQDRSGEGLEELANRISTNHTFFYRERAHFDYFTGVVLPEVAARCEARGELVPRIWCAGCSTGEEPYTLMMLMLQFFGGRRGTWRPMLLATDISAAALGTAVTGEYTADRLAPLPAAFRQRYFHETPEGCLRVAAEVRHNLSFRRHNLMDATFPFRHPFDVIFCRNVMIYFDRETRNRLVTKFFHHARPGGHLFIGHSETLARDEMPWTYLLPAVYHKLP